MQFQIANSSKIQFTNFNARTEKHGPESVPAADLTLVMDAPNTMLNYFGPGLMESMYGPADADDDEQEELDGIEPVSTLPKLKFPGLAPLKIDKKLAGYALTIDYGLGEDSAIEIHGCDVGKFTLECKEGGTVQLKFQVQCQQGLTEQIMGKLAMLNGQELSIRLLAPVVAQSTTDAGENPFPIQGDDAGPLTAEQVFLQGSDTQMAAVH